MGLSSGSSFTLDASQAYGITADVSEDPTLTWALSGSDCSGTSCGSLSSSGGVDVTYKAPQQVSSQVQVTLVARVVNTKNSMQANIKVNPDPKITGTLAGGMVGQAYSGQLSFSGGTAPLAINIATGSLPAGLSFNAATGIISGTPTVAGAFTFTVQLTDSSVVPFTVTAQEIINIAAPPLVLTMSTLPNGTINVPYSATIGIAGGTSPYSCSITAGTLPAGLILNGCTVSGIPSSAGTSTVTLKVTDSSAPTQTISGPQMITIAPAALALTSGTLPNGTVDVPYSAVIGVVGGTTPYNCTIASGSLPTGLKISGCTVSGTPTVAGSFTVNVNVTDSSKPTETTSGPQTIIIAPAGSLTLTTSTLPNGKVGTAYSATIGVTGGTAPYNCTITAGSLPVGLSLGADCQVSGTPTTAGTSTISVTATDSSNPSKTVTGPETIVITPAALSLSTSPLPNGTVGTPYSGTIVVAGGTAPYTCVLTSGSSLPTGLSMGSGCTVSGTPQTSGTFTFGVTATDSSTPKEMVTGPETIVINAAGVLIIVDPVLPGGIVDVPYTTTIGVSGGTNPIKCSATANVLPNGLTLASDCTITGTPVKAGTFTFTVTVTDSSTPAKTVTGPETIVIAPPAPLAISGKMPNAVLNQVYSYSLTATGGIKPYDFTVTSGTLPAGISMSTDGVFSGTPTAAGARSFTVTVTDNEDPAQTASLPLILLVTYPSGPNNNELKGPYAYLFQGYDDKGAGLVAYQTAAVGSFTADGFGGISAGELDANHQASTSTTTVATQAFIGTYEVNADNTGLLTITTFSSAGLTDQTFTYTFTLKAPISPSTISIKGDLIEYDNNQLAGTRGSGTLFAQTSSAFSAGLSGDYAFGVSGDTPCLISCTVGLLSGPTAAVGQFNLTGGTLAGTEDTTIASTNYAQASITGSYQPADQNGRLQMSLSNGSVSGGEFPVDFAAYMVNTGEFLIMSTDTHASYILLAGSAQQQAQGTFSNASLNGPFIGYENAQTDPGLLGTTLQSVLNFSSSTIFRASGDGSGSCDTTNVDNAGLVSTIDNLTGIANKTTLLQALVGSYEATGTSSCQVNSNGRGELEYPQPPSLVATLLELLGLSSGPPAPRVFYLVSPNSGYFLETGYAAIGSLQKQTGEPFSLSSLDGTYVDGTIPASSLASINTTGTFAANGNGNADYTLTSNIGVGTINILQASTSTNTTYSLSDPNSTVTAPDAGRYILGDGTTVLYAISPETFVLLNTSVLNTSPSISLLY